MIVIPLMTRIATLPSAIPIACSTATLPDPTRRTKKNVDDGAKVKANVIDLITNKEVLGLFILTPNMEGAD